MAGALASHADPFAVLVQQNGDRHKRAREKRKQGARPINPEVDIHSLREQRESRAEHGTNEVISGKNARSVVGICVCKVIQDGVL